MALSGTEEQSLSSLHPAGYHYVGIGMLRVTKSGAEHTSKSGAEHTPCLFVGFLKGDLRDLSFFVAVAGPV